MPNWCHNTLQVSGEHLEVIEFTERAKPSEQLIKTWHDERDSASVRTFDEFAQEIRRTQPLTFHSHVPEPEDWSDWIKIEPCNLCNATGARPAAEHWDPNSDWAKQCNGCNGCHGVGSREAFGSGWYAHHTSKWGTKWDANFEGDICAIGDAAADVDVTVAAHGERVCYGEATYEFTTAWSPPVAWLLAASALHPSLRFELVYGEWGNQFAGRVVAIAGEATVDEELPVEQVLPEERRWF